jgi:multiple sugar transport system ATP-binding protein
VARIELAGLTRREPDGSEPVRGVDLDVADGELVVLLGPSGSGKSTLLRMIVGLDEISSGELRIDGEVANDWAPRERDLAMVFQNYAPYPHLTVRENIAFPLRLAGMPDAEIGPRVAEAAAALELTAHLDRRPSQLSGGQRQRLAVARVVVRRPNAYLFDEPLSSVDAGLRAQLRATIGRLRRDRGTTTLYVTHDQAEALSVGDRVAVLRGGRVQQVDTPEGLYRRPANLFVAGFVGSPPMNLLPGHVAGGTLRLPTVEVPLDDATVRALGGRERVTVGVRPEHFEDAALVAEDRTAHGVVFTAAVETVEWTGSELYAYLRYRVPEAPAEPGVLVARLDPASTVRDRPVARVWMDTRRLLFFDPAGAALGGPDATPPDPAPPDPAPPG